jgi:hypothetical protein
VNALYRLRITDQLFNSLVLHEWCGHNRLFNAYYEVEFKKTPDILKLNLKFISDVYNCNVKKHKM